MKQKCRVRVESAIGRPLTDPEVKIVDKQVQVALRSLSRLDPGFNALAESERLLRAADYVTGKSVTRSAPFYQDGQTIRVSSEAMGGFDVIASPSKRDISTILNEQRRAREPQSVRWLQGDDGVVYAWDGNKGLHFDVARHLKMGAYDDRKGEINSVEDLRDVPRSALQQAERGATELLYRGQTFAGADITFFEGRDISTVVHEGAHYFLGLMEALAAEPDASTRITKLLADTRSWMGLEDGQEIGVVEHELFARTFESYMREGRSPSIRLQDAFRFFRAWLIRIYRSVMGIGEVKLNDEVRDIFDRMLATDQEIERARKQAGMDQVFKDQKSSGMSDVVWAHYLESIDEARRQAEEELMAEVWRAYEGQQQKGWNIEEQRMRQMATLQINGLPGYRAHEWLSVGRWLPGLGGEDAAAQAMESEYTRSDPYHQRMRTPLKKPTPLEEKIALPVYRYDLGDLIYEFNEGYSFGEIADLREISESTVKAYLSQIRSAVRRASALDGGLEFIAEETGLELIQITNFLNEVRSNERGLRREARRLLRDNPEIPNAVLIKKLLQLSETLPEFRGKPPTHGSLKATASIARKALGIPPLIKPFTEDEIARITALAKNGFSSLAIARKLSKEVGRPIVGGSIRQVLKRVRSRGEVFFQSARRDIDRMGFFSAVQESVRALPPGVWKGGWPQVRATMAKGGGVQGWAGRIQDEMKWLGLDERFADTILKGEELRQAVADHVDMHRLYLVERFDRFDPTGPVRITDDAMRLKVEHSDRGDYWISGAGQNISVRSVITSEDDGTYSLRRYPSFDEGFHNFRDRYKNAPIVQAGFATLEDAKAAADTYLRQEWTKARYPERSAKDAGLVRGPGDIRLESADEPIFELVVGIPKGVPGADYQAKETHIGGKAKGTLFTLHGEERLNDEGKKTFFVGQAQSDLAQEIRSLKDVANRLGPSIERRAKALNQFPSATHFRWNGDDQSWEPLTLSRAQAERMFGIESYQEMSRTVREGEIRIETINRFAGAPMVESTSQWTGVSVRTAVFRAARDGFDAVAFPTGKTSTLIQGNDKAAAHYDTNVKGALEKIAAVFGAKVRVGGVQYNAESDAHFLLRRALPGEKSRLYLAVEAELGAKIFEEHKALQDERIAFMAPFIKASEDAIKMARRHYAEQSMNFDERIVLSLSRPRPNDPIAAAAWDANEAESKAHDTWRQTSSGKRLFHIDDLIQDARKKAMDVLLPQVIAEINPAPAYVLDITPEMREAVLERGMPLFQGPRRPAFFSAVERFVADSKTARASGEQWWATISKAPGIKREELEWMGLEEWLKARDAEDMESSAPGRPSSDGSAAPGTDARAQVLAAAQARFDDHVSWNSRLVDVDAALVDAGVMDRDGFMGTIVGLSDEEAETLSSAGQKVDFHYEAPLSALPERYWKSIERDSSGMVLPSDLVVEFNDRFDPFTPIDEQDFFPTWRRVNADGIEERLRQRLVETERPKTLQEAFGHPLHTVRAAAFQAALDVGGVQYRMPKEPQIASEYYMIDGADEFSDADTLKVRFSDHFRQSNLHDRADFNLNTETTDANDVLRALRFILSKPEYAPSGAAALLGLDPQVSSGGTGAKRARGISREDVLAFVRANGVRVEEVALGEASPDAVSARREQLQRELLPLIEERDALNRRLDDLRGRDYYSGWKTVSQIADDMDRPMSDPTVLEAFNAQPAYQAKQAAINEAEARLEELQPQINRLQQEQSRTVVKTETRWSSYTLPGGENYTELLLTLPVSRDPISFEDWWSQTKVGDIASASPRALELARDEYAKRGQNVPRLDVYRSSHWDHLNVLAHVRFKDRTGPNGERILALEEVQSDWHQAGRERGYAGPDAKKRAAEARALADAATAELKQVQAEMMEALQHPSVRAHFEAFGTQAEKDAIRDFADPIKASWLRDRLRPMSVIAMRNDRVDADIRESLSRLVGKEKDLVTTQIEQQRIAVSLDYVDVPDAPFKNNAWASLALKRMIMHAVENGYDAVAWIPGNIQNGRVVENTGDNRGAFYDKVMVNIANDLGKKYGAKVGETRVVADREGWHITPPEQTTHGKWMVKSNDYNSTGLRFDTEAEARAALDARLNRQPFHTLFITDAMREAVEARGLPLFQDQHTPPVPTQPQPEGLPRMKLSRAALRAMGLTPDQMRKLARLTAPDPDTSADWIKAAMNDIRGIRALLRGGAKPTTLKSFVRRMGGVRRDDDRGDIADRIRGNRRANGILTAKGMPMDDMALAAWENGYFPQLPDRPTINQFIDALSADIDGREVVAPQSELDRMARLQDAQDAANYWRSQNIEPTDELESIEAALTALAAREVAADNAAAAAEMGIVHPDDAAPWFGFSSGNEMVQALLNLPPRMKAIRDLAYAMAVQQKGGDPFLNGEIATKANEAAHSAAQANVIEIEMEAIAKATGRRYRPMNAYAKQVAQRQLDAMTGQQIIGYERFLTIERRHAKAAQDAFAAGNFAEAERAKTRQIVTYHLYRLARDAAERLESQQRYLRKFDSDGVRAKIDIDYLDQIDQLLDQFELRPIGPTEIRRRLSLARWVEQMKEQGLGDMVQVDERRLDDARRRPLLTMTTDEINGLVDTIRNLEHLGRLKERLLVERDKRAFNAVVDELVETMQPVKPLIAYSDPRDRLPGIRERASQARQGFHAQLSRVEFLAEALDGNQFGGPVWRALFKPFADARAIEETRLNDSNAAIKDLFSVYSAEEMAAMWTERKYYAWLPNRRGGMGSNLTKQELLAIALNWGTEYNRGALMEGEGWSEQQVLRLLEELDQRDWEFVQRFWDYTNTFWPEIEKLYVDLTGTRLQKVEASPVTTRFGTFAGGYYHLEYDFRGDQRVKEEQKAQMISEAFSTPRLKTYTRNGFTKARAGSGGRPILLDLSVGVEHINQVIHDLSFRRPILDAHRLVSNSRFRDAFIAAAGEKQYDELAPWIAYVATEQMPPEKYFTGIIRTLRRNTPVAIMGYAVSTVLQQIIGPLNAAHKVGLRRLGAKMMEIQAQPWNWRAHMEFVDKKSALMRDRVVNREREMREMVREMQATTNMNALRVLASPSASFGQRAEALGAMRSQMIKYAFYPLSIVDKWVASMLWRAAYDQAIGGHVKGADPSIEKDAVDYADQIVRTTMGSGRPEDLSPIQRSSEIGKLITPMFSFFNVQYNQLFNQQIPGLARGRISPIEFMTFILLGIVINTIASEFLAGRGLPDDDEDEEEYAARMALTVAAAPAGGVPIVRDITRSLAMTLPKGQEFAGDSVPAFGAIASGTRAIQGGINDAMDGELDRATMRDFVMTSGFMFGIPARQLWITGEYATDVITGEEDPARDPERIFTEGLLRDRDNSNR